VKVHTGLVSDKSHLIGIILRKILWWKIPACTWPERAVEINCWGYFKLSELNHGENWSSNRKSEHKRKLGENRSKI